MATAQGARRMAHCSSPHLLHASPAACLHTNSLLPFSPLAFAYAPLVPPPACPHFFTCPFSPPLPSCSAPCPPFSYPSPRIPASPSPPCASPPCSATPFPSTWPPVATAPICANRPTSMQWRGLSRRRQ
ncbi:unnamed protein product [Closterium sp. NIES-65]|nr:unnamed protein product [Closterium sp. NIES-65]